MTRLNRSSILILSLASMLAGSPAARATDQFFAGDGSALSASKWGTTNAGPFTSAFTNGNVANFSIVNGTGTGGTISVGGINVTENFTITAASGTLGGTASTVNPITVSSGKTFDAGSQGWSTGATVGFSLTGPGVFATSGSTFGGGFVLNSGTLVSRGVNAMGSGGTLTINGGTIASSANRTFTGKYAGGITIGGDFQLGALTANVALSSDTATLLFDNAMSLGNASRTITIGANGVYTINSLISGTGSSAALNVNLLSGASGTLVLGGANSYSGGTTLTAGTLQLSGSGTLGSTSGSLTVNGGTLNLSGTTQGVGNLTGSGGTILNNGTATNVTLTIGNGNGTGGNYQGVIANNTSGTGTVAITKTGTGTITLSGINTYSGGTAVNVGTLLVNGGTVAGGSSGTGSGNVTVDGSGTTLGGTGRISGTVTLGNTTTGAVLNPGANSTTAGTLTTGAVTMTSSVFHVDAFSTAATGWDKLSANGVTLLGTSTLELSIASGLNFSAGQTFTLIDNTAAAATLISGTFSNAPGGCI